VFNVGSGGTYSINRLVELLGPGEVVHVPKRPGEPDCTLADITRIREVLGWTPRVSFEEGVREMLRQATTAHPPRRCSPPRPSAFWRAFARATPPTR
jgi:nucleoside-diphosphate-sugar epimerase